MGIYIYISTMYHMYKQNYTNMLIIILFKILLQRILSQIIFLFTPAIFSNLFQTCFRSFWNTCVQNVESIHYLHFLPANTSALQRRGGNHCPVPGQGIIFSGIPANLSLHPTPVSPLAGRSKLGSPPTVPDRNPEISAVEGVWFQIQYLALRECLQHSREKTIDKKFLCFARKNS